MQFKKFVNQSKIIIFNTTKEIEFINNELNFQKIGTFQKNRFYSLINIFKQIFPFANQNIISLNKCCEFLEIRLPKEKIHTSKHDCFAVCKILSKLYDIINIKDMNKEEKKIEIKNEKINLNLDKNIFNNKKDINSFNYDSKNNSKNSDNEFDYSDSLIDIIEEENRNTDENMSENIIINNSGGKNNLNKKIDLNDNKKKEIKFLNNKRKIGFEDLINNLKNKVNPCKVEDNTQIDFDPNELKFEK